MQNKFACHLSAGRSFLSVTRPKRKVALFVSLEPPSLALNLPRANELCKQTKVIIHDGGALLMERLKKQKQLALC